MLSGCMYIEWDSNPHPSIPEVIFAMLIHPSRSCGKPLHKGNLNMKKNKAKNSRDHKTLLLWNIAILDHYHNAPL